MDMRLEVIGVPVADVDAAKAFYVALIGAVFGVASFMLLQAGLLSLTLQTKPSDSAALPLKALFLLWGLAFLAGFSERWTRDMLNIAGHSAIGDAEVDSAPATKAGTRSAVTRPASKQAAR